MSARRLGLIVGVTTLVATVTLVTVPGAGAQSGTAGRPGGSSTSQVVRAGAKAIGRTSGSNTSGLVSLHSSQATGAVMPTPGVYLVFWGSQWSNDPARAAGALQGLFGSLYGPNDTWGTIMSQYCEGMPSGSVTCSSSATSIQHPTSSLLRGVWFDSSSPAPSKATTSQIAGEAVKAAAHFSNLTQTPNLNAQYVIASPSGTHPDGFPHSFCAWHSSTSSSYGNIAFTNLPYVPDLGAGACTTTASPRLLDGYESSETHEYAESVTDPFPSNGWLKGGAEIGDLCENQDAYLTLGGQTFDVQGLWSNHAGGCVTSG
jgi:serine protease